MSEPLNIHYLQHAWYEGLGCIRNWAHSNHHNLSCTKLFRGGRLPSGDEFDWLIVMGGPMGVYEEEKYPWLKEEKKFIREAIEQGKTVIGICLGAQLIASVLGGNVYKNKEPEIGWFPVSLTKKQHPLVKNFEPSFHAFHWHGDTFDLPESSVLLAKTPVCSNQMFLYKKKVLGIQFHFEVTEQTLTNMAQEGKDDLKPANYVQPYEEIVSTTQYISRCNEYLYSILDYLSGLS